MVLPSPIAFFSGMRIKQLACGDSHTLVLNESGVLYSFGRGQNGQLGLGNSNDSLQPQLVGAFWGQTVEGIAAGSEYSMALTEDGQIFAFGWGRYGNLGDGHCQDRFKPTAVCGLSGVRVRRVQCGWRHSAVTSDDGRVFTFGWNKFGQLGHGGKSENCSTALQVTQLANVNIVAVSCGWRHSLAADDQGRIYAWGWNKFGQLGVADLEDRCSPVLVSHLVEEGHRVATLSCGWRHSMALTDTGLIFTWGRGVNGQLGHGRQEDLSIPTLVDPGLFRASSPSCGAEDSLDDSGLRVPDCSDQDAPDSLACVPLVPQRTSLVELDASCAHKRNRVCDKADEVPLVKHTSLEVLCKICS